MNQLGMVNVGVANLKYSIFSPSHAENLLSYLRDLRNNMAPPLFDRKPEVHYFCPFVSQNSSGDVGIQVFERIRQRGRYGDVG